MGGAEKVDHLTFFDGEVVPGVHSYMDLALVDFAVSVHLLPHVVDVSAQDGCAVVVRALVGVPLVVLAVSVVGEVAQQDRVPVDLASGLSGGGDGGKSHAFVTLQGVAGFDLSVVSGPERVVVAADEVDVTVEASDDLLHVRRLEGEVSEVEDDVAWFDHGVPALNEVLVHGLHVGELVAHEVDDPTRVEVVSARVMGRHGIYSSRIVATMHKVL